MGALAEFAKSPSNRILIRKANGIPSLVLLLSGTNDSLLINVANALGQCAEDSDCMMSAIIIFFLSKKNLYSHEVLLAQDN